MKNGGPGGGAGGQQQRQVRQTGRGDLEGRGGQIKLIPGAAKGRREVRDRWD